VRFASECLAFANVPDEVEFPVHHPRWKSGVPRDAGTGWDLGAGWDFDDVRDHYLGLLYDVDPVQLRRSEHDRYLDLSRAVSGEVMAEVIGDWRRAASPCRGALVLWLKDMLAGAGLGVLDHRGAPKVAYYHLRRIFSPVAVWMTDERVAGIAIHIANERPEPLRARLRVTRYQNLEARVDEASEELDLPPRGAAQRSVEDLLGRFVDAAWAYRFGPPGHDVIVASLERDEPDGIELLSQAFHFPAGLPSRRQLTDELGLTGALRSSAEETLTLTLLSKHLAYGVRVHVPGFRPSDDALTLEPGVARTLTLSPTGLDADDAAAPAGTLTALNMRGSVRLATQKSSA
jgi:beta-mannosidase